VKTLDPETFAHPLHLLDEVIDAVALGVGEDVGPAAADEVEEDDLALVRQARQRRDVEATDGRPAVKSEKRDAAAADAAVPDAPVGRIQVALLYLLRGLCATCRR
jgi:hypothetical protein